MAEPQAPAGTLNESDRRHLESVRGWCCEALAEGEAFLKTQKGYSSIPTLMDYIMGDYSRDLAPGGFSKLVDNRIGKIALDFSAAMTDIKPFWDYHTFNPKFEPQAIMGGKITKHWWTSRLIDLKFADCIKYAAVAGTGYPHLCYSEQLGDIDCIPEDPRDVLPIRPANNSSLQDCFGVIVRRERTVNYLKAKYPHRAAYIHPDRDAALSTALGERASSVLSRLGMASGFMENVWASIGGKPKAHLAVPTADTFTIYLRDTSRNETSSKVWVGEGDPGNNPPNWSYWVEPGDLIYPRLRSIVFTRSCVLRDGPSIYWHGLFPLIKLTLDPWPWSWLGKPPLLDILPWQDELNRLIRGVSDHNQKVFRPDVVSDKNALSRAAMDKLDTRRSGLKLRHNPVAGKPVELIYAQPLDPSVQLSIMDCRDEMDKLTGVHEVQQLMNLGQIPATETIEKILETMSPSIRMRSRSLEASLREFAMMTLSNVFQFRTLAERVAILGPDGMTFEDYDEEWHSEMKSSMIPAHLTRDDQDQFMKDGTIRPQHVRAKEFLRQFTYDVAPGSLLSASEVTTKLLYIQLFRAGILDVITLYEKLGIPNVGTLPGDPKTIIERLAAQLQMGIGQQVSTTGRKASGQTEPHMKPGGNIVESK